MKNQKGFIPVIIILVVLIGIGGIFYLRLPKYRFGAILSTPLPTSISSISNWKTYVNTELGYSIKIPSTWSYDDQHSKINVSFENNQNQDVDGNFSILVTKAESIDKYLGEALSSYYKSTTLNNLSLAGVTATKVTTRLNNESTYSQDWFVINKNRMYIISYTTYQEVENKFDQILSTFKFID